MNQITKVCTRLLLVSASTIVVNAQDIHKALTSGDVGEVQRLVNQSPELVNAPNEIKSTPLHIAASKGLLPIVQYLIDKGADVNVTNKWDMTPLHYAASNNYLQIARLLIEKGADVNGSQSSTYTPLHAAAGEGHKEMVDLLINSGADVKRTGNRGTPLHRAAYSGNTLVMASLVNAGADINATYQPRGWSPLHQAALSGRPDATKFLIEKGADLNIKGGMGETPLYLSLLGGNRDAEEVAIRLLEGGADCNTVSATGETPLLVAVRKGYAKAVELIIQRGSDIQIKEKETGRSLLHLAAINGYGEVAKLLVGRRIDMQSKDVYGSTAFEYAVKHGHKTIVDLLSKEGVKGSAKEGLQHSSLPKELEDGEAYIWKLATRGWAVKTKNNLLVFDYEEHSRRPDIPLLANGFISSSEISDQNILAIYTAYHAPANERAFIHGMEGSLSNITYLHYEGDAVQGNINEIYMSGRGSIRVHDVDIAYSEEHNSEGMGWLSYGIEVDGITILYAGFPNARGDEFAKSLSFLGKRFDKYDLAFFQAQPQSNEILLPDKSIVDLRAGAVFLNHSGQIPLPIQAEQKITQKYEALRFGFIRDYGDRYHYKNGRLKAD